MKTITKLMLASGAGFIGYSIYKANELKKAVEQVSVKIAAINNIKVGWDTLTISLKANIQLINPTNTPIGLSTAGAIKIKRIAFYNRNTGVLIGEALTDISGISIEPQSSTVIDDIAVTVPVLTGVLANFEVFNTQKELLAIELTTSILGKEYTLTS